MTLKQVKFFFCVTKSKRYNMNLTLNIKYKDKIVFYFRGFVEFFSHSAETKAALAENKVFCKVKQMIS